MPKGRGVKKGERPKSYEAIERNQFQNLSPEERRRIAKLGVEARRKKKQEKMFLQKCMRELLGMRISNRRQKEILREMGIDDKDLSNETLLMVALFKKGITGDVGAISKIIEMMEKLDMMEKTGKMLQNNVVINLIPSGQTYEPNEEDEKEIWEAENEEWMDDEEDDDEWGNEVYNP